MTTPLPFRVMATYKGQRVQVGTVQFAGAGWRFLPMFQAGISRRAWPTPQEAVAGRVKNFTLEQVPPKGDKAAA